MNIANILVVCVRSAISVLLPNPSASLCVPVFEKRVLSRTNYLSPEHQHVFWLLFHSLTLYLARVMTLNCCMPVVPVSYLQAEKRHPLMFPVQ